ncbi:MAG: HNH endonuclease signature motif containing protein [Candidatus Gastranaerophilaceae bacterium]|jgi:hypothetical protein
MKDLLPKLKYFISAYNNSSYKYLVVLSIIYCFNGKKRYSFEELLRFIIPFYFNMAVRFKIVERAGGKIPKVVQNIINYSKKHKIEDYLYEGDFDFLCKQNLRAFFSCPLVCFEQYGKVSKIKGENTFFKYSLKEKYIELTPQFYTLLNDRNIREIAKDIVLLALVKFLEKYNTAPNIYHKISGEEPKRDLSRFKRVFMDKNSPLAVEFCCICTQPLKNDFSLDHFIPFNYLHSDDIWNLIPAHQRCNSFKNKKIGSDEVLDLLIERNRKLYEIPQNSPYFDFLQKELFCIYPTFESLYKNMMEIYASCKSMGYQEMDYSKYREWPGVNN